jgi:hypothetical protein
MIKGEDKEKAAASYHEFTISSPWASLPHPQAHPRLTTHGCLKKITEASSWALIYGGLEVIYIETHMLHLSELEIALWCLNLVPLIPTFIK